MSNFCLTKNLIFSYCFISTCFLRQSIPLFLRLLYVHYFEILSCLLFLRFTFDITSLAFSSALIFFSSKLFFFLLLSLFLQLSLAHNSRAFFSLISFSAFLSLHVCISSPPESIRVCYLFTLIPLSLASSSSSFLSLHLTFLLFQPSLLLPPM